MDYRHVSSQVFSLYEEGKYHKALQVIQEVMKLEPDFLDRLYYWQACLYSVSAQPKKALRTLKEALKKGYWWHPEMLARDPDLKALQHFPEYQALLAEFEKRRQSANAEPRLIQWPVPEDHPAVKKPLVVSLHWKGDNGTVCLPLVSSGIASSLSFCVFPVFPMLWLQYVLLG